MSLVYLPCLSLFCNDSAERSYLTPLNTSMSRNTDAPHTAIVTVDALAAAFQHFNITHVAASEFFGFITQGGDGYEWQAAAPAPVARGAVIPVCMYVLARSANFVSNFFVLDDGQPSPSEVAHLTKNIPTPPMGDLADIEASRRLLEDFMTHPVLPYWLDANTRLGIIQQCKEQARNRGVQYDGPDY